MKSARPFLGLLLVVAGALALAAAPHAGAGRAARSGVRQARTCSDLDLRFHNRRGVTQSEERHFTREEAETLGIQAESNGGVEVEGWDQDLYSVTLCKAADPEENADKLLSEIHLTYQNREVGVSGPSSHERWSAYLLVRAPKSAALNVRVNNGPVSLFRVDGALKVNAKNGPIELDGCSGDIDLSTQNGPVTLAHNSGKLRVDAQNGPVTLALSGPAWDGAGLEAHASNGPLTVSIPSGYQSGVLVQSNGNGPFACAASVCSTGRKNWDDNRRSFEFGSRPAVIRISTENGPVTVQ